MNYQVHLSSRGRLVMIEDMGITHISEPMFSGSRQQCLNYIREFERTEQRNSRIAAAIIYTSGIAAIIFTISIYWN